MGDNTEGSAEAQALEEVTSDHDEASDQSVEVQPVSNQGPHPLWFNILARC